MYPDAEEELQVRLFRRHVAELLARVAGIRRVLVVTPASLKAQWRAEIERFSGRAVRLVVGGAAERADQYEEERFFTVCNYEQVLRDLLAIERVPWDLIVLDEGQRIENREAKTSSVIKRLRSLFALVLSGTPLENRLEELHSVVEFVDARGLGPQFRFQHRHRVVDERGRVLGYRNLVELRARLVPVLLRRTRAQVLAQLPPRTTEILRIEPTAEQLDLHAAHMRVVISIVTKRFISEMDLLRLRKALLACRLSANGTFLVDRKLPGCSSKMQRLAELLDALFVDEGRKSVLFSEWLRMLDAIEPLLEERGLGFVRLDGKVPQKRRQSLVKRFRGDPDCRLFLSMNAGASPRRAASSRTRPFASSTSCCPLRPARRGTTRRAIVCSNVCAPARSPRPTAAPNCACASRAPMRSSPSPRRSPEFWSSAGRRAREPVCRR